MKRYVLKINKINKLPEIMVDWNENKVYIPPVNGIFQKKDNKHFYYNLYTNNNDINVIKSVIDIKNGNYFFEKNSNLFFLKGKKNFLIIKNFENNYTICEIKDSKIITSKNIEILKINFLKQRNSFVIHYNKKEDLVYFKTFIKLKKIIELNKCNKLDYFLIKIHPDFIIGYNKGRYFLFKKYNLNLFNIDIFIFHYKFAKIFFTLEELIKNLNVLKYEKKLNSFYYIKFYDFNNVLFLDPKFGMKKIIMNFNETNNLNKYIKLLLKDCIDEIVSKKIDIEEDFELNKLKIEKIKNNLKYLNIEEKFLEDLLILKNFKNILFFRDYLNEELKTKNIQKILNYYLKFEKLDFFLNKLKELENAI